jgi:outer membrane immunogenic protein
MDKLLASVVGLALLSGSAIAADLPILEAPIAPVPQAFSWTGFYAGAAGGYSFGEAEVNIGEPSDRNFDVDGWTIGAFAGFNYQVWRSFVTGIEADIEWADIQGDESVPGGTVGAELNWQGSIRGRLGYAIDRALVYGTGGFVLADIDTEVPFSGGDDGTEWGWTLGAGLDFAVTEKIFVRGEYRYTNLSDFDNDDASGEIEDFHTHAFRVGVGYLF